MSVCEYKTHSINKVNLDERFAIRKHCLEQQIFSEINNGGSFSCLRRLSV